MENMNVADIIKGAFENKPTSVEDSFNNVIQQKMADAIELRRQEISQSMYGGSDNEAVEPDVDNTESETDNIDHGEPTDEDI